MVSYIESWLKGIANHFVLILIVVDDGLVQYTSTVKDSKGVS